MGQPISTDGSKTATTDNGTLVTHRRRRLRTGQNTGGRSDDHVYTPDSFMLLDLKDPDSVMMHLTRAIKLRDGFRSSDKHANNPYDSVVETLKRQYKQLVAKPGKPKIGEGLRTHIPIAGLAKPSHRDKQMTAMNDETTIKFGGTESMDPFAGQQTNPIRTLKMAI